MAEDNEKVKFIKNTIGSREKYHEIITKYTFTDSEKDILLQATANIMHSNIDKLLIYEAYELLVPKIQDSSLDKKIPTEANDTKIEKRSFREDFAIIFILIIIGVIIANVRIENNRQSKYNTSHSRSSKHKKHSNTHGAWAYMQIFVKKQLKSPKSVNFPFGGGTNHTTDLGEGRYKVNSYVDAQNTFGANTRTYFEGVIKRKNGGWVLEYLTFKN